MTTVRFDTQHNHSPAGKRASVVNILNMRNYQTAICLLTVVCAFSFAAVLQYEPLKMAKRLQNDINDIWNIVMKPHVPSRYIPDYIYKTMGMPSNNRLTEFRWLNCGDKTKENILISDLKLGPDPISLPGTLNVSFSLALKADFPAPVSAVLVLEKKIGPVWIKIPCLDNIGSCSYSDICTFLENVQCPPEFVAAKIPCKCPFPKGAYTLPLISIEIEASFLPSGDYHVRANVSHAALDGGCYDIYFTFE